MCNSHKEELAEGNRRQVCELYLDRRTEWASVSLVYQVYANNSLFASLYAKYRGLYEIILARVSECDYYPLFASAKYRGSYP